MKRPQQSSFTPKKMFISVPSSNKKQILQTDETINFIYNHFFKLAFNRR